MFQLNRITLNGDQRPRLDDISVEILIGRTAVVGYSGAGKTSLLNVMAGFESPDQGTVGLQPVSKSWSLKGNSVRSSQPAGQRLPLFWVPQNGGLWPHLTVDQHLSCFCKIGESSDEILCNLNLEHRRLALPAELSQGERSRLALARALASRAEWLLMDEPLSHVDPVRKPDYWAWIHQWLQNQDISTVFTSHEPETVLRNSTQIICLHEGRIVFQGGTQDLYESPPDRRAGEFVGPLNWFEPREADLFLSGRANSGSCIAARPEKLAIQVDDSASVEFISMPFRGVYSESLVKHVSSGETRTILHQTGWPIPVHGQRVSVRLLHELC